VAISDKKICDACVREEYLRVIIDKTGEMRECSYCGNKYKTVTLEWLAETAYSGIQEHFHITSSEPSGYEYALSSDKEINYEWNRKGQQINELLQDILSIDESAAKEIQEYLSNVYSDYEDIKLGEEDPFGDEAHYEESPADQYDSIESWRTLCSEVKTRARFFSPSVEKILDELFGDLNTFKSFDGTPVAQTLSPEEAGSTLYRARVVRVWSCKATFYKYWLR